MPIEVVTISAVFERPVGRGGQAVTKFDICTPPPGRLYQTFDPLKASLCQRAMECGFPVRVTWKDGRYGYELVTVERVNESEAA